MKVYELEKFRQRKKKLFLSKNKEKLENFIKNFLVSNFNINFTTMSNNYFIVKSKQNAEYWDYIELRNDLFSVIDDSLTRKLLKELKNQPWFKSSLLRKEELSELILSIYILDADITAISTL